jgi:hypothetical protein
VNATYVFEKGISRSSTHEYEEDLARRWWTLPLNVNLPLTNGHEPPHSMRGLAGSPRADRQALDMSRLRLEREPTLPTKLGTRGYEASSLLYGTALNRRSGLSQCVVRSTVG